MELIGETKKKILLEIAKQPIHGYRIASNLTLPLSTVYGQSTVYGHLRDLRELGLIEYQMKDRQIIYELTEKGKIFMSLLR